MQVEDEGQEFVDLVLTGQLPRERIGKMLGVDLEGQPEDI